MELSAPSAFSQEWLSCDVCGLTFKNEKHYLIHCGGMFHANRVAASRQAAQTVKKANADNAADYTESSNPSYWTGMQQEFSYYSSSQSVVTDTQGKFVSGQSQPYTTTVTSSSAQSQYVSYPVGKLAKPSGSKGTEGYEGLYGTPGFGWSSDKQAATESGGDRSSGYWMENRDQPGESQSNFSNNAVRKTPQTQANSGYVAQSYGAKSSQEYGSNIVPGSVSQKPGVPNWLQAISPETLQTRKTDLPKTSSMGGYDEREGSAAGVSRNDRDKLWKNSEYSTDGKNKPPQRKEGPYGRAEVSSQQPRWDSDSSLSRNLESRDSYSREAVRRDFSISDQNLSRSQGKDDRYRDDESYRERDRLGRRRDDDSDYWDDQKGNYKAKDDRGGGMKGVQSDREDLLSRSWGSTNVGRSTGVPKVQESSVSEWGSSARQSDWGSSHDPDGTKGGNYFAAPPRAKDLKDRGIMGPSDKGFERSAAGSGFDNSRGMLGQPLFPGGPATSGAARYGKPNEYVGGNAPQIQGRDGQGPKNTLEKSNAKSGDVWAQGLKGLGDVLAKVKQASQQNIKPLGMNTSSAYDESNSQMSSSRAQLQQPRLAGFTGPEWRNPPAKEPGFGSLVGKPGILKKSSEAQKQFLMQERETNQLPAQKLLPAQKFLPAQELLPVPKLLQDSVHQSVAAMSGRKPGQGDASINSRLFALGQPAGVGRGLESSVLKIGIGFGPGEGTNRPILHGGKTEAQPQKSIHEAQSFVGVAQRGGGILENKSLLGPAPNAKDFNKQAFGTGGGAAARQNLGSSVGVSSMSKGADQGFTSRPGPTPRADQGITSRPGPTPQPPIPSLLNMKFSGSVPSTKSSLPPPKDNSNEGVSLPKPPVRADMTRDVPSMLSPPKSCLKPTADANRNTAIKSMAPSVSDNKNMPPVPNKLPSAVPLLAFKGQSSITKEAEPPSVVGPRKVLLPIPKTVDVSYGNNTFDQSSSKSVQMPGGSQKPATISGSTSKLDSKAVPISSPAFETKVDPKSSDTQRDRVTTVTVAGSAAKPVTSVRPSLAGFTGTASRPEPGKMQIAPSRMPLKNKDVAREDSMDDFDPALSEALGQFFGDDSPAVKNTVKPVNTAKASLDNSKSKLDTKLVSKSPMRSSQADNQHAGKEEAQKTPVPSDKKVAAVDVDPKDKEDPLAELSRLLPPDIMKQMTSGQPPKELLEKVADLLPADVLMKAITFLMNPSDVSSAAKPQNDANSKRKDDSESSKPKSASRVQLITPRKSLPGSSVSEKSTKGQDTSSTTKTNIKPSLGLVSSVSPLFDDMKSKQKYDFNMSQLQDLSFDDMLEIFQELLQDVLGNLLEDSQDSSTIGNERRILDSLSKDDRELALNVQKATGVSDVSKVVHTLNILKSLNSDTIMALSQLDNAIVTSSLTGNKRAQAMGVAVLQSITDLVTKDNQHRTKDKEGQKLKPTSSSQPSKSSGMGEVKSLLSLSFGQQDIPDRAGGKAIRPPRPAGGALLPTPGIPPLPTPLPAQPARNFGRGLLPTPMLPDFAPTPLLPDYASAPMLPDYASAPMLPDFALPPQSLKRGPPRSDQRGMAGPPAKRWR